MEKDDLLGFLSPITGVYGADLIGDQIVPVNVLGTEYIPMYGNLSAPGDKLFITATQDLTTISLNGTYLTTINAGQTYRMSCPNPSGYLQTSFPAYVYQLSGIGSEVGSALLPQINCTGSQAVSLYQSSTINFKLNLLVKAAGIGNFLVNGVAGAILATSFVPVPGTAGAWYSAQIVMPVATYPTGSVLNVTNTTNLFQLGFLSSGPVSSGASFGYYSNYGGINPNPTTSTPSLCIGDSILLVSDSISGASYVWSGPGGFASTLQNPFVSGAVYVDSGTYKIVVTTPGCSDSGTVNIAVHPYPSVNLGPDTTICGSTPVTLDNLDSASVYSTDILLWNTGVATASISVSTTGTYWLNVSNAGCAATDTIHVSYFPVTAPTATGVTYCQYDAAVPLTAAGTSLLWYTTPAGGTGSAVAPTPPTTTPGVITYYVTETLGPCESARTPVAVTVNALPPYPAITVVNPYCQGQPFVPFAVSGTGVLWYSTATGGTGSSATPVVNTNTPGADTFYATQTVSGCESPRQLVAITVLDSIIPSFTYTIHYGCKGDTVLFTNSSTGAVNYLWDFGDGSGDTITNPTHIFTTQDTFIVNLAAINGHCSNNTQDTIALIHPLQAAFIDSPNILCQDNIVTFTNNSIGTGLSYMWYLGNGAVSNTTSPTYTYSNSGVYTVQLVATDFVPCHDTASGIVYVDSQSYINMSVTDSVLCRSTYTTFGGIYTGIGNTGVTWNFGDGDSIKNVNPVSHGYDTTGTFTVIVTAHFRACNDTSFTRNVTVYPQPYLNLGPDTSICAGSEPLTLADNINTKIPDVQWKWNTGQTTSAITVTTPGEYYLIVNIAGCHTTDSVLVQNDCYLDIPNVFTPNGDGLNDYFFPRLELTKGLTAFKMDIYNRWGQLIFESTSLDGAGWDGKLNGVAQPEGVFVYVIDATFKDGQKEHHQGNVTLLR